MGSNFDAFRAGITPAINPTPVDKLKASKTEVEEIMKGKEKKEKKKMVNKG